MASPLEQTPLLSLPFIQAAQAQKHITHNEAIALLDLIVQLVVEATTTPIPPTSAAEGQAWIVADGATGAWAGHAGAIAAWQGGGWVFVIPQTGWRAWDKATAALIAFDGTHWAPLCGAYDLQNLDGIGVNTSFDATNKLAVAATATLLTHDGSGHQLKINKAGLSDTATVVYQTNWSGRAEVGLAGNDDFSIKVSPDGSTFITALNINTTTGAVETPATATRQIVPYEYRQHLFDGATWSGPSHDPSQHISLIQLGTGAEPDVSWSTRGLFIPAGSKLHSMTLAGYINHADVAGLDLRICYQTGPWGSSWNNAADFTREVLFAEDNNTTFYGDYVMQRQHIPLTYTAPSDGYLFVLARPNAASTLTATRYFYIDGAVDMSCPPPSA